MAESVHRTPAGVSYTIRQPASCLLQNLPQGTPFRTPHRRRFGPVGSSKKTPHTGHQTRRVDDDTPVLPRSREARAQESANQAEAEELAEKTEHNLKELMKKTWHVFRLTPLYNFSRKKSDLQLYSRSLSACIAAETKKGVFVDMSVPDDAVVNTFTGLDVGNDDPNAILVEVRAKTRKNILPLPVVCQAVLFSTDLEYNPLQSNLRDSFTYYSTMLVNGPDLLSKTVQGWLEEQFDCRVIPQTFSSHEIGFMTALFTGLEEIHKPVELVYRVPEAVEGLDKITYSTEAKDCTRLWDSVRSNDEESFTSQEARLFIAGLESHFYEIFNIKLGSLQLVSTGTSVALVSREGKIKLQTRSTENVLKVCRHLTDLALDKLIVC